MIIIDEGTNRQSLTELFSRETAFPHNIEERNQIKPLNRMKCPKRNIYVNSGCI